MSASHMLIDDRLALNETKRSTGPLRLLPIHLPNTLLPEVIERGASGWMEWDAAVLQLEFADQSERLAWTR